MTIATADRAAPLLGDLMPGSGWPRMDAGERERLRRSLESSTIEVVGATGAVGLEAFALLAEAGVPAERVLATGSSRSAGSFVPYGPGQLEVRATHGRAPTHALLATPSRVSRELAPLLAERGVRVVDCSSAFRGDPDVPLVVPEINGGGVGPDVRLIAAPNCTTTIALMAAAPIRDLTGLRSLELVSYQSQSGAGLAAMRRLIDETRAVLGEPHAGVEPGMANPAMAFNVYPHESEVDRTSGLCGEEAKVAAETRRILDQPDLDVHACCVRVASLRSHVVVLRLHTEASASADEIRGSLRDAAGVRLAAGMLSAGAAAMSCVVLVDRVHVRPAAGGGSIVRLIVAGDQLLRGAAWNALACFSCGQTVPSPP
ncbi:MAG: aspartate-semialdehyde dehydrogenase [Planctomycetota bacterium]